jgi:hypothetical protein
MNRTVRLHLKSLLPEHPDPDAPVFYGGGSRPNNRFRQLCESARVAPKQSIETGEVQPWVIRDLRKTCATYYDEHVLESLVEILGHSAGRVTHRHYAHQAIRRLRHSPRSPRASKGGAPSAPPLRHRRKGPQVPFCNGGAAVLRER